MTTVATMVKQEKRMTGERKAKTLQTKSRGCEVTPLGRHTFSVKSTSGKTYTATVDTNRDFATCTCDWGKYRPEGANCGCSHVVAVLQYMAQQDGASVSVWANEEDAERQHLHTWVLGDGLLVTVRR